MKAWKYYRDRDGDYLLVRNKPITRDLHDAAAPEHRGKHRSVDLTVVNTRYIARCTEVPEADVPDFWREALTGVL